ncbi:GNAT family N-acetyltransferase [Microtetraspora malaysiensis]|uniref:GNAT family N-acetyltransferase n=1 Tax=Microtetraspora malaysiensis TaxID=161358 RepID=UPI003D9255A4
MSRTASSPGDLELLDTETRVLWDVDARGRLPGPEALVIAVAPDGVGATVAATVPDDLAARLLDLTAYATPSHPGRPPAVLEPCRALLEQAAPGDWTLSAGPSYLVRPPLRFDVSVAVLRSDRPADAGRVRAIRPGNWEPDEWEELLDGGHGAPWTMIADGDRVASICHTPRRTRAGAEAGTWTDPAFRGRGYAAATTAAWADLLSADCPHLFYSTSADNLSSQRVAGRLGLRAIGWLWKLTRKS